MTQRGRTFGFAFGTIKAGEAQGEEDGRMRPASKCCCIRVLQASLYLHGEGYDRDFIVFSASYNFIDAYMFVGRSLTCGIGSKTSLKSFRASASCFARDSAVARISIRSRIAPATLKSSVTCGQRDRFLNQLLQTSMSSANISFLSAFVSASCSCKRGLGGGGGEMVGGFNKS